MDTQPNFKYLCRVCAVNTKGRNSVPECVYIFKTPELKDRIEKYLYLSISEHDALPKVLCKTCFRQVEATASLSRISKHTQKVFRDFVFNRKPPSQSININYDNEDVNATAEFTPLMLNPSADGDDAELRSGENQTESTAIAVAASTAATAAAVATAGSSSSSASSVSSRKDEVVVNVSVSDPLTRETQQKMINASQKRKSSADACFTPKSIAQRAFTTSTTKKQTESIGSNPGSTATAAAATIGKKPSPPGVINFIHGRPQQVTTFTSGGYIIGRVESSVPEATAAAGEAGTAATKAASSIETAPGASAAGHVLQQKRKNLKMALNSIKAANTGQVSLLKASQKLAKQTPPSLPPPPAEASSHALSKSRTSLAPQDDDVQTEELPEKMIIAAAKHRKKKQQQQRRQQEQHNKKELMQLKLQMEQEKNQWQQLPQEINIMPTPKAIITESQSEATSRAEVLTQPDDILLGTVIKDIDLLKLILKALKWPATKQTMDSQISRLRGTKFTIIMSDPNLLQDTDLTQILGPYVAPSLMAAHAIQQQQLAAAIAVAEAIAKNKQSTALGITSAIPYKLPAETSVQLVPASPPTDPQPQQQQQPEPLQDNNTSKGSKRRDARTLSQSSAHDKHSMPPPRKLRKAAKKARDSIVISDEDYNDNDVDYEDEQASTITNDRSSIRRSSKSTPNFLANIDPSTRFAQLGFFAAAASSATGSLSSSTDALAALLQRQQAALSRTQRSSQRRKRSNSIITVPASGAFDFSFDQDDIVLMEQQLPHQSSAANTAAPTTTTAASSSSLSSTSSVGLGGFLMPQPVDSVQFITRPIIKRRKTVIQASPARTNLNINKIAITTAAVAATTNANPTATTTATATANSTTTALPSASAPMPIAIPIALPLPSTPQKKHSQRASNSMAAVAKTIATTQYSATTIGTSTATQVPSQTRENTEKSLGIHATKATSSVGTSTPTLASAAAGVAAAHSEALPPVKTYSKKVGTSKSALGKQLLEAVGLQKITSNTNVDGSKSQLQPAASSRESVQQIRSALKKSLQKAQEQQQQRKQEEPIIQDADSTTKSIVKEVKSINLDDDEDELDVEAQIDKITLMKPKTNKQQIKAETESAVVPETATATAPAPDNKDLKVEEQATEIKEKDRKKKVSRIPSMRRRKSVVVNKSIKSLQSAEDKIEEKADVEDTKENDFLKSSAIDKRDLEFSGSAATLKKAESIISLASSKPSTPRKRGRKTKAEKKLEDEETDDESEDDDDDDDDDEEFKIRETPSKRRVVGTLRKGAADRDYCEKDSDTASVKNDGDAWANISSPAARRPTRISKTLSKYYKGPEETTSTPRRSVPMRSTRNRT